MKIVLKITFRLYLSFIFAFLPLLPSKLTWAQSTQHLPPVGTLLTRSIIHNPINLRGITIHPEDPFLFNFIVHPGDSGLEGAPLEKESTKLIKYFMAALTIPEDEMWVNLSPYEKERIIPHKLGQTEMGRDLLAQDYLLKQLTASLMYPEDELGDNFWHRVYQEVYEKYGTTEIPVDTFTKVWIVPEKAVIYENENSAFLVESHLKVMLEKDYLALENNLGHSNHGLGNVTKQELTDLNEISAAVIKDVLIPEIEDEVNNGKHFEPLRQIYNASILATWFKQNMHNSILNKIYIDQNKIEGINIEDKTISQKIYNQYLSALKKGVFNYIREDYDPSQEQLISRNYFSGGLIVNPKEKITFTDQLDNLSQELEGGHNILASFGSDEFMSKNTSISKDAARQVFTNFELTNNFFKYVRHIKHPHWLIFSDPDKKTFHLQHYATGKEQILDIPSGMINNIQFTFSEDGKQLAVYSRNTSQKSIIRIFNIKADQSSYQDIQNITGPSQVVFETTTNRLIVIGQSGYQHAPYESTIRLANNQEFKTKYLNYIRSFDLNRSEWQDINRPHDLPISNSQFEDMEPNFNDAHFGIGNIIVSPDKKHLLFNYKEGHQRVFDMRTGKTVLGKVRNEEGDLIEMAEPKFSPTGNWLIFDSSEEGFFVKPAFLVPIANINEKGIDDNTRQLMKLIGPNIQHIELAEGSNKIILLTDNYRVEVIDITTHKASNSLSELIGSDVAFVNLDETGNILTVNYYHDKPSAKFDLRTEEIIPERIDNGESYSADQKFTLVKLDNDTYQVLNTESGQEILSVRDKNDKNTVDFTNHNRWVKVEMRANHENMYMLILDLEHLSSNSFYLQAKKLWKHNFTDGLHFLNFLKVEGIIETVEEFHESSEFFLTSLKELLDLTTDYNRPRVIKLLQESKIFKTIKNNGGDWKSHLELYLELMRHNKRLAVGILEGLITATKDGLVSSNLVPAQRQKIKNFIKLSKGFNHTLYEIFDKRGESELKAALAFGVEILADNVGPEELDAFVLRMNKKGFNGEKILLGVVQHVIPLSGASFVLQDEAGALLKRYRDSGDRRGDIPEKLRQLGRFGGGKIQKIEWILKDGEIIDPQGELQALVFQLQYPDAGKIPTQIQIDTQADREACIHALQEFANDPSNNSKRTEALNAFLKYTSHNDHLREKVEKIRANEYLGIDLLDQLFRDKDNLSTLLRKILRTENIKPTNIKIHWDRNIAHLRDVLLQNTSLDMSIKENKKIFGEKLGKLIAIIKEVMNSNAELPNDLDADVRLAAEQILKEEIKPLKSAEIIAQLFETPLTITGREKAKFEEHILEGASHLKFQVVKGPAYGMYGLCGGVCIAKDVKENPNDEIERLWEKEAFYLLAMIDESIGQAVGFVHLFEKEIQGEYDYEVYLTTPGIEPSSEYLSRVKAREVFPYIEDALQTVELVGEFKETSLPTNPNILSNRADIINIIEKKSYPMKTLKQADGTIVDVDWNTLPDPYPFSDVYVLPSKADANNLNLQIAITSILAQKDLDIRLQELQDISEALQFKTYPGYYNVIEIWEGEITSAERENDQTFIDRLNVAETIATQLNMEILLHEEDNLVKGIGLRHKSNLGPLGNLKNNSFHLNKVMENLTTIFSNEINHLKTNDDFMSMANPAISTLPNAPGGIDLNPDILNLEIHGQGTKNQQNKNIDNFFNPDNLNLKNIDGFHPIIINISPLTNIPMLLGTNKKSKPFILSQSKNENTVLAEN